MKICMISGTLPPAKCGVGDYTDMLCSGLSTNNDIDISIITSRGLSTEKKKYNVFPIVEEWTIKNWSIVIQQLKKLNPDIVHIQYPTALYKKHILINLLPIAIKFLGYKIITTIHEYSDNSIMGKVRVWPNLIFSDEIIVVDESYKFDISKNILFKNKKIKYINIGSNIPKSSISKQEKIILKDKILQDGFKVILGYFGFIHPKKGFDSILYALKEVKDKDMLHTKLLIIGELDKNNEYHKNICDLIKEFNLEENVYISGYLPKEKVADYLNVSDYVVLPFVDGLSTKNGSFLAAHQENKPIITTRPLGKSMDNLENVFYLDKYDDINNLSNLIIQFQEKSLIVTNDKNSFSPNEIEWNSICDKHIESYYQYRER